MKSLVTVVLTLLVAVPLTATAAITGRTYYLNLGDGAVPGHDATVCTVVRMPISRTGFRCKVGGDYRGKYGVMISSHEVALTQYASFSRFKVVLRKRQSAVP
jgi:hypothetical protein